MPNRATRMIAPVDARHRGIPTEPLHHEARISRRPREPRMTQRGVRIGRGRCGGSPGTRWGEDIDGPVHQPTRQLRTFRALRHAILLGHRLSR